MILWYYDQIFTPWFFDCITQSSMREWKRRLRFANISISSRDIFKFEKWVKYANEMTDDVIHSTQYYSKHINGAILANLQCRTLKLGSDSSTENVPVAIKNSVPMATHSSPVPTHLISICKWLSARKTLNKARNSR